MARRNVRVVGTMSQSPLLSRSDSERHYRRGAALGFTLAELFTIVLFVLLLVLAATRRYHEARIEDSSTLADILAAEGLVASAGQPGTSAPDALRALIQRQQRIVELLADVSEGGPGETGEQTDFDDLFRRLLRVKEENRRLKAERASLREELRRAEEEAKEAREARKWLEGTFSASAGHEALSSEVRKLLQERDRLRYQLSRPAREGGGGTEMPPCWVTETGTAEYPLTIELIGGESGGALIVRDNRVAGHDEERPQLFRDLVFDAPLGPAKFLDQTKPFYRFGKDRDPECRFFVRVVDRTAAHEKDLFKHLLRTVEAHFYKLLVEENSPEVPRRPSTPSH
jgi:hypothetical protein